LLCAQRLERPRSVSQSVLQANDLRSKIVDVRIFFRIGGVRCHDVLLQLVAL
jgi:hypothetical protein